MPDIVWSELGQALSGLAAILTFLAIVVGGAIGLRRYRHGQKIRAADLLLKLEEEFRSVLPMCVRWETISSYESMVGPLIENYMAGERLDEDEIASLMELDRCLRFFYLCTV